MFTPLRADVAVEHHNGFFGGLAVGSEIDEAVNATVGALLPVAVGNGSVLKPPDFGRDRRILFVTQRGLDSRALLPSSQKTQLNRKAWFFGDIGVLVGSIRRRTARRSV